MTLTFDLQGHGHICALWLIMQVYISKPVLCDQYLERYGDLNAFAI